MNIYLCPPWHLQLESACTAPSAWPQQPPKPACCFRACVRRTGIRDHLPSLLCHIPEEFLAESKSTLVLHWHGNECKVFLHLNTSSMRKEYLSWRKNILQIFTWFYKSALILAQISSHFKWKLTECCISLKLTHTAVRIYCKTDGVHSYFLRRTYGLWQSLLKTSGVYLWSCFTLLWALSLNFCLNIIISCSLTSCYTKIETRKAFWNMLGNIARWMAEFPC